MPSAMSHVLNRTYSFGVVAKINAAMYLQFPDLSFSIHSTCLVCVDVWFMCGF